METVWQPIYVAGKLLAQVESVLTKVKVTPNLRGLLLPNFFFDQIKVNNLIEL